MNDARPDRSRRRLIAGLSTLGIGALALGVGPRLCAQAGGEVASLPDFRRPGDRDDTAALLRAVETGLPIHAPAGRYKVAMTAADDLPSNLRLFGDGLDRTVFERSYTRAAPFILHADSRSPAPGNNLVGWRLSDLAFEDDVAARGFSEHDYLVMLSGVTDARLVRVGFRGFRGDGLYLGSSTVRADERHNRNVVISECLFDGVNANNRNAISVIDCDGLVIERSRFLNVTRPGNGRPGAGDAMNPDTGPAMPGAIDFEPDEGFNVVRNCLVRNNHFEGGGGFAVTIAAGQSPGALPPRAGFRIEDNVVVARRGAFAASGYTGDDALAATKAYDVLIRGNRVSRTVKPFLFQGMRGLNIDNNEFVDCAEQAELGYQAANADVRLTGNRFVRVGTANGYALWIRALEKATIATNDFVDCGRADGQQGIAIAFYEGRMRDINLDRNRFSSPTGRSQLALKVFPAATIEPGGVAAHLNSVSFGGVRADPALGF